MHVAHDRRRHSAVAPAPRRRHATRARGPRSRRTGPRRKRRRRRGTPVGAARRRRTTRTPRRASKRPSSGRGSRGRRRSRRRAARCRRCSPRRCRRRVATTSNQAGSVPTVCSTTSAPAASEIARGPSACSSSETVVALPDSGTGTRRCVTVPVHSPPAAASGSRPHVPSISCTRDHTSVPSTRAPDRKTPRSRRSPKPRRYVALRSSTSWNRPANRIFGHAAPSPGSLEQRVDQRRQPVPLHGRVVVDQGDEVDRAECADAGVAAGAEAAVRRQVDHLHDREFVAHAAGDAVVGRVVDQHDTEPVGRPFGAQEAVQALEREVTAVVVDDDDADGRCSGSHQPRCLSGSHHQRLSRYHATVASSASSSVRCLRQPSAVTLVMSTE